MALDLKQAVYFLQVSLTLNQSILSRIAFMQSRKRWRHPKWPTTSRNKSRHLKCHEWQPQYRRDIRSILPPYLLIFFVPERRAGDQYHDLLIGLVLCAALCDKVSLIYETDRIMLGGRYTYTMCLVIYVVMHIKCDVAMTSKCLARHRPFVRGINGSNVDVVMRSFGACAFLNNLNKQL